MAELRKDYFLNRYVIIATERSKRPNDFKTIEDKAPLNSDATRCFFCPGNEHLTPPEIMRVKGENGWQIRVFDNKFPAVTLSGNPEIKTADTFFTYADAVGKHEVVVEMPEHKNGLSSISPEQLALLFKVFNDRIRYLQTLPGVKYVQVFKNRGEEAGTSIEHTHSQIIAFSIVPINIIEEESAMENACQYCRIINIEKRSDRRIAENKAFVSFAPYASRFPFEAIILPKRHLCRLDEFSEEDYILLAEIFLPILKKLEGINAPYNYLLHYGVKNLHLHFEVLPRLTTWAGFELATGTIINTVSPEKAAEFYRT